MHNTWSSSILIRLFTVLALGSLNFGMHDGDSTIILNPNVLNSSVIKENRTRISILPDINKQVHNTNWGISNPNFHFPNSDSLECPEYANTVTSNGIACAGQDYKMEVKNSGCQHNVYFTVQKEGEIYQWKITSNLTGDTIAQNPNTGNIGPIDLNQQGKLYKLSLISSDPGSSVQVLQNGDTIVSVSRKPYRNTKIFDLKFPVASSTMTVHTPFGDLSSSVDQCEDFSMNIPLDNPNFCTAHEIDLSWDIVCHTSGDTLAKGIHHVTIYPKVPEEASDLVDISWNENDCSWKVTPNHDCNPEDIGNIYNISPNPDSLIECGSGTENFTITYNGIVDGPNCWETAGPETPYTYEDSYLPDDVVPHAHPYSDTISQTAGYLKFPPNNNGGQATEFELCIEVNNYCINSTIPDPYVGTLPLDDFKVSVFINGLEVFLEQESSASFSECIYLDDLPVGYTQNDTIEIYVFPYYYSVTSYAGTFYTEFVPDTACAELAPIQWTGDISATLNVTFEETIKNHVDHIFYLQSDYQGCSLTTNDTQLNQCSENEKATFDLTQAEDSIISAENFSFTYYQDEDLENQITTPQEYEAENNKIIYVLVENTDKSCSDTAEINLQVYKKPQFDLPNKISTCSLADIKLDASPTNMNESEVTFEWFFGGQSISSNSVLIPDEFGTYTIKVHNTQHPNCETQAKIILTKKNNLTIELEADKPLSQKFIVCPDEQIEAYDLRFTAHSDKIPNDKAEITWFKNGHEILGEDGFSYTATFECGNTNDCFFNPTYRINIKIGSCEVSETITPEIQYLNFKHCTIPEGISPGNYDGLNDELDLSWLDARSGIKRIEIFNRYGTKVFNQDNYSTGWHGQDNHGRTLPSATYYYFIKLKNRDPIFGKTEKGWLYVNQGSN